MGRPAARADPQAFDRLAADYDRNASLEPPLVLDWLLTQLPGHAGARWTPAADQAATPWPLADRFDQVVGVDATSH